MFQCYLQLNMQLTIEIPGYICEKYLNTSRPEFIYNYKMATSSIHYLFDSQPSSESENANVILNSDFGVVKFQFPNGETHNSSLKNNVHFIISCDRSGSMHPHMKTLRHLLRNIVQHLKTNDTPTDCSGSPCNIYLSLLFFDHEVKLVYQHKNLDELELDEFVNDLENIHSRGMTNFQRTLTKVSELCEPDDTNIHIFMTDGEITDGAVNTHTLLNVLASSTDDTYDIRHAWVGFGTNHQVSLMQELTSQTNGNYFFVDKLEYAGFVYGEILSKELNRAATNITFSVESEHRGCVTLYDAQTNAWGDTVTISQSEYDETIFVHCTLPHQCRNNTSIKVSFTDNTGNMVTHYVTGIDVENTNSNSDMKKYVEPFTIRQDVLEVTYDVLHKYGDLNAEERQALLALLDSAETTCNEWLETPYECQEDDPIQMNFSVMVNQLCDDVKMAKIHTSNYNTQLSPNGMVLSPPYTSVYLGMRHISQTQQRGYTPGHDIIAQGAYSIADPDDYLPRQRGSHSLMTPPTVPRHVDMDAQTQVFSFAADPQLDTPPHSPIYVASTAQPSHTPLALERNLSAYTTPLRSQAMQQTQSNLNE